MTDLSNHNQPKEAYEEAANVLLRPIGYRIEFTGGISHVDQDTGDITVDPTKARLVKMEVVPPPVIEPPEPVYPFVPIVPADATHLYFANDGDDSADGLTEATAVQTPARVTEIIAQIQQAQDNPVFAIRPRRGDLFPSFGRLGGHLPSWRPNQYTDLKGSPDRWHTVMPYGDPNDGAPVFEQSNGSDAFAMDRGASYIQIIGIDAQGGQLINCISNQRGLALIDCTGSNSEFIVQAEAGNQFQDLHIHRCRVRDVKVGSVSSRRQGFFLSRVGGTWTFCDNIMLDCGWAVDGGQSTYNHGLYATGENGPVTEAWGNVAIGCSGAGMQFRSAGDVHTCFAALNGDRGINWGETRGSVTNNVGGTGSFHDCVAYQLTHDGAAMAIGNILDGDAYNLTAIADKGPGVVINANRGDNSYGGRYVGINNLSVADCAIRGASQRGAIELEKAGWGYEDGSAYGVKILLNKLHGGIGHKADFADALGKVVIGANDNADLSHLTGPPDTQEFREDVWSRRLSASDLVKQYGANQ